VQNVKRPLVDVDLGEPAGLSRRRRSLFGRPQQLIDLGGERPRPPPPAIAAPAPP